MLNLVNNSRLYILDQIKKTKFFYMTLNDLNNDFTRYQKKSNGKYIKVSRPGKFYLCWIDHNGILHHYRDNNYKKPYSSTNIFKLLDIVMKHPKRNWFMPSNTFYSKRTRSELRVYKGKVENNIRTLTSFYFDFDVVKSGIDMNNFYYELKHRILKDCHIHANVIINSGHGFHVYIVLNSGVPANSFKILRTWRYIQNDMINKITAECKSIYGKPVLDHRVRDINRLLRVPISFNMKNLKNPKRVVIEDLDIDTSDRLSFKQLKDYWFKHSGTKHFTKQKSQINQYAKYRRGKGVHSIKTLNLGHCKDFFTIAKLRRKKGIKAGARDYLLFYYAIFALRPGYKGHQTYSDKETKKNLKELNSEFLVPKNNALREVISEFPRIHQKIKYEAEFKREHKTTKSRYCPNNATLIHDLHITRQDQHHLRVTIDHQEAKRRKPINYRNRLRRRRSKRKLSVQKRKRIRLSRNQKIYKMKAKGFTHKQIANWLGISTKTVQRAINSTTKRGGH